MPPARTWPACIPAIPSIYGAIAEQMRRLDALGIPYEVVPGVPAFAGAAARLAAELTLPEISQTIILTRTSGKASSMPESESLEILGQAKATLCIHLSIRNLAYVETALTPHYGADCPVVIIYRATWPDEEVIHTTLGEMRARVREEKITRTALIMVGRVFGETRFRDSSLYDEGFAHVLRNVGKKKQRAGVGEAPTSHGSSPAKRGRGFEPCRRQDRSVSAR